MIGWEGLDAASSVFSSIPERWADSSLYGPLVDVPPPGRDEMARGFSVVEQALAGLGPPDDDEPTWTSEFDEDLMCWVQFGEHFLDRRGISATAVRAFLTNMVEPPPYPQERQRVSWRGLMRAWLRAQLGMLANSILMDAPAFYEDDPIGLRDEAFRWVKRIALMLPDGDQASAVATVAEQIEMEAEPLATKLYHHPNAGPRMKAVVHRIFEDWVVERIKANVPASHDSPPWL